MSTKKIIFYTILSLFPFLSFSQSIGNYDVTFYDVNLDLSSKSLSIIGDVKIEAKSTVQNLTSINIDLHSSLMIDSILVDNQIGLYTRTQDVISIDLNKSLLKDEAFLISIFYHGNAYNSYSPWGFAVGMVNESLYQSGKTLNFLYTVSEFEYSKYWWPCKQNLADKADSIYVKMTCPASDIAISNGKLFSTTTLPDNKKIVEWRHLYPINFWNIFVALGDYQLVQDYTAPVSSTNPKELQIYNVFQNPSTYNNNKAVIDLVPEMITYFSDLISDYPFENEKYGMIEVNQNMGGLENQTAPIMQSYDFGTVAHELVHQWFGNHISGKSFKDVWIHEGFAQYGEYLIAENFQNLSSPSSIKSGFMRTSNLLPYNNQINSIYIPDENNLTFSRIFSSLSYNKGAALLHMIRYEVGDSLFFQTLKNYMTTFEGGNADAEDFKGILNQTTGRNFDSFFTQWYYGEGCPTFNLKYEQKNDSLYIEIHQTTSSYITPEYNIHFPITVKDDRGNNHQYRFYSKKKDLLLKIPFNGVVSAVYFDYDDDILNENGTISQTQLNLDVVVNIKDTLTLCSSPTNYTYSENNLPISDYKWYYNDTLISSSSSVDVIDTGYYVLEIIDHLNRLQSDTFYVNFNSFVLDNITKTDTSLRTTSNVKVNWYSNSIFKEYTSNFSPNETGFYYYSIDTLNCTYFSDTVYFEKSTLSLENITTDNSISIYPNPVEEFLNINLNDYDIAHVTIIDALGKVVLKTIFTNKVDVSIMNKGVYTLILSSENGASEFLRFIKN